MTRLNAGGITADRLRVSEHDRRFRDLFGLDPTFETLAEGFAFTDGTRDCGTAGRLRLRLVIDIAEHAVAGALRPPACHCEDYL